ncbi:acyl-CoA dehydrogenase [Epidermidibacterium keratini]|uniref:Acyl-CoA dehydrogenase n=1 Tax=Epidermidibacterium keratini TaxID=1891644 RepID=A0A7L4YNX0_9ACTN|nr:acyl-CoA dehydrogenase family protein [Epidermidibacterium keratini]QHC00850.1 acyl-CoA dehydrogenase [Epidermidibacterium keratini]
MTALSTTDTATESVADKVEKVLPRLRELGREAEQNRWIPQEAIDLLDEAGVWRVSVPERFGGLDLSIAEKMRLHEQISSADGSIGWVAGLWMDGTWIVQLMSEQAQAEIFANGSTRVSTGFAPTGTIVPTEGGYILNGSWKWNSGCRGADWIAVSARLERPDGPPEINYVAVPQSEGTIADDWYSFAASATGSSEVTFTDVFVPEHRIMKLEPALISAAADVPGPKGVGHSYGLFTYITVAQVASFLGMAKGAYELFMKRLPGRGITYTPWTDQSASPLTQIQVAEAANKIAAAEALSKVSVEFLQGRADEGKLLTVEERAQLRGQSAYAIELARQAVETLYKASGASVIMLDVPFQRFYRDMQGLTLHATVVLTSNLEVHGRVLVGLDPATPFL